jgi:hypothetical protein
MTLTLGGKTAGAAGATGTAGAAIIDDVDDVDDDDVDEIVGSKWTRCLITGLLLENCTLGALAFGISGFIVQLCQY